MYETREGIGKVPYWHAMKSQVNTLQRRKILFPKCVIPAQAERTSKEHHTEPLFVPSRSADRFAVHGADHENYPAAVQEYSRAGKRRLRG